MEGAQGNLPPNTPDRVDLYGAYIDPQIHAIYEDIEGRIPEVIRSDSPEFVRELFMVVARAAYVKGVTDQYLDPNAYHDLIEIQSNNPIREQ